MVVLTGDLVGSTRLAPDDLAQSLRALELASQDMARTWRGAGEPRFSSFRGDGWQCVGPEPRHALRAALLLRARLARLGRSFDTRISIGIGAGWLREAPNLNLASGPAFELSGRGLDAMKTPHRFVITWESPPRHAGLLRAVLALCDEISRKWTPKQAEVLSLILPEAERPGQKAIARALDITQQSVADHLSGAGDWALAEALEAWEAAA